MKEINDFPGYFITEDGKVYSAKKTKLISYKEGFVSYLDYNNLRELKQKINKKGYYTIHLQKDGKSYTKTIHRLVAETYTPNPNNLPQVNHIDENKLNNCATNLEWMNNQQNTSYSICRYIWKIEKVASKEIIECINLNQFCRTNDLDISVMRRTYTGKRKQHKGYKVIGKIQFK
jgi:hypothetical protein